MGIFNYQGADALGVVVAVDTATVVVRVSDIEKLQRMQVNRLVALQSSRAGEHLIGVIQKIVRSMKEAKFIGEAEPTDDEPLSEENVVRVALIGTHIDKRGIEENLFRRTLGTVPEIDANCFAIEGDSLTAFMRVTMRALNTSRTLERVERTVRCRAVSSSPLSSMGGARRMRLLCLGCDGRESHIIVSNCVTIH